MTQPTKSQLGFPVDLPAGGTMYLLTPDEVALFESSVKKFRDDYAISKLNDLAQVGALVTQQVIMLRAQQMLAGLEPEFDGNGHPTGQYKRADKLKPSDFTAAQKTLTDASTEIRKIEAALGIDKKTRESGGQHTVSNYLTELKKAAHQKGVRIMDRVKEIEEVWTEAEWKLRVLENGDDEDKNYHDLTEEKFCDWLRKALADIREADKTHARTKGKLYLGKL